MSEIRANAVASLKERLTKLNASIAEQAGDADGQNATYDKYATLFQGLSEGLTLGGNDEEAKLFDAALTHIDSQIAALKTQSDLDALLA